MKMLTLQTKSLANIVKVEIKTHDTVPKTYSWETASKAGVKPYLSEGSEEFLRVKNTILATNRYEDIVIGYDIEFEDNAFAAEVFALVDGGTLVYDEIDTDKLIAYNAPVVGAVVSRTVFDLAIYTEEKDIDGMAKSYAKLVLKNCKGKPAEYELEDGKFMVPKLTVASRPKSGESPISIEFIDSLLSGAKTLSAFSFAEQTGPATINEVAGTIDIEVANGTAVAALIATFTASDLATVKVSGVEQVSGTTANNFTSPVTYTVTAEDGTTKDYVVTVTVAI